MTKLCIHCFVTGKVQGVWFRASTKTQAEKLSLTGWVRNLADGRVEVFACGEEAAIQALEKWLRVGPKGAQVTNLTINNIPWQEIKNFEVRFTEII